MLFPVNTLIIVSPSPYVHADDISVVIQSVATGKCKVASSSSSSSSLSGNIDKSHVRKHPVPPFLEKIKALHFKPPCRRSIATNNLVVSIGWIFNRCQYCEEGAHTKKFSSSPVLVQQIIVSTPPERRLQNLFGYTRHKSYTALKP